MERILGQKGNYRLYNDGCATVPYIITIERKRSLKVALLLGKEYKIHLSTQITEMPSMLFVKLMTNSMMKFHRRVIFPMGTSINQLNYYEKGN